MARALVGDLHALLRHFCCWFALVLAAAMAGCTGQTPIDDPSPATLVWVVDVDIDESGLWIAQGTLVEGTNPERSVAVRVLVDTGFDGTIAVVGPAGGERGAGAGSLPSNDIVLELGRFTDRSGEGSSLRLVHPPEVDTRAFTDEPALRTRADLVIGSGLLRISPPVKFRVRRGQGVRPGSPPVVFDVPLIAPKGSGRDADSRPFVPVTVDGVHAVALVDTGCTSLLTRVSDAPATELSEVGLGSVTYRTRVFSSPASQRPRGDVLTGGQADAILGGPAIAHFDWVLIDAGRGVMTLCRERAAGR